MSESQVAPGPVEFGSPDAPNGTPTSALVTVELQVTGMHCGSCVALIEESLLESPGVLSASVDLDAALATVSYDGAVTAVANLCDTVAATGYTAVASHSQNPANENAGPGPLV
jgi:Cu+-exporting ATPase